MKNLAICLVLGVLLVSCKATYYPEFKETKDYYGESLRTNQLQSIHQFAEGVYHFDVCMKDTTLEDQNIKWFCDCKEPEKQIKETISVVFVDDVRVVYYKNFDKKNTELSIDKLDRKYLKVGVYKIYPSPINATQSEVKMTLRYPSSKDSLENPIHLYFQLSDTALSLTKMEYVKREAGVMTDSEGGLGTLSRSPARWSFISPPNEFSYQTMDFVFAPTPFQLKENKEEIQSIQYQFDPRKGLQRITKFKKSDVAIKSDDIDIRINNVKDKGRKW
jgi:hypothetical protein